LKKDKKNFLIRWILLTSIILPVGAIPGYILNLFIHGKMGYSISDVGPPLLQTLEYCIWITILTATVSFIQWIILQKQFKISSFWILACVLGGVIGELLSGIVLWKMGINRADLGPAQGGSIFTEVIIFLFSGTLIGLFQYPFMRKNFHKSGFWILASALGWGLIPAAFLLFGGVVLSTITGMTLVWIMKPKGLEARAAGG